MEARVVGPNPLTVEANEFLDRILDGLLRPEADSQKAIGVDPI